MSPSETMVSSNRDSLFDLVSNHDSLIETKKLQLGLNDPGLELYSNFILLIFLNGMAYFLTLTC